MLFNKEMSEEMKKDKGTSNLMEFTKWTKIYLKSYWNVVMDIKYPYQTEAGKVI